MKTHDVRKELLERAAQIFGMEEEEIMDPEECGKPNCIGCEIRHGIAKMLDSNPAGLTAFLDEVQPHYAKFEKRFVELTEQKDRVLQLKEDLDAEVETYDRGLVQKLSSPSLRLVQ